MTSDRSRVADSAANLQKTGCRVLGGKFHEVYFELAALQSKVNILVAFGYLVVISA